MATKQIGVALPAVLAANVGFKIDDPNPRRASVIVTNRSASDLELVYSADALYGLTVRAGLSVLLETEGVVAADCPLYLRGAAGLRFTAVIGYYGTGQS